MLCFCHTASSFTVSVGQHYRDPDDPAEETTIQTHAVSAMLAHQSYDDYFLYNDIALVSLETPIKFNSFVQPACLPNAYDIFKGDATISGWGQQRRENRFKPVSTYNQPKLREESKISQSFGRLGLEKGFP
jgi:hypothetical protein